MVRVEDPVWLLCGSVLVLPIKWILVSGAVSGPLSESLKSRSSMHFSIPLVPEQRPLVQTDVIGVSNVRFPPKSHDCLEKSPFSTAQGMEIRRA